MEGNGLEPITDHPYVDERDILKRVIDELHRLDDDARTRVLKCAEVFYGLAITHGHVHQSTHPSPQREGNDLVRIVNAREPVFGNRPDLSAKDFLHMKDPATDVDRVVCLAYYLAHYKNQRHFKTVDISSLNTEAAQVKFSNTAFAVENAAKTGLLVSAGKGSKQLSAIGERYVDFLPDRGSAKELLRKTKIRSKRRRILRPEEK